MFFLGSSIQHLIGRTSDNFDMSRVLRGHYSQLSLINPLGRTPVMNEELNIGDKEQLIEKEVSLIEPNEEIIICWSECNSPNFLAADKPV